MYDFEVQGRYEKCIKLGVAVLARYVNTWLVRNCVADSFNQHSRYYEGLFCFLKEKIIVVLTSLIKKRTCLL